MSRVSDEVDRACVVVYESSAGSVASAEQIQVAGARVALVGAVVGAVARLPARHRDVEEG